ncbi:hypothetical protein BC937DRAFT_90823 [Endogone sp. FLAS-F59071]|nr:hypothetical protein BC937DRAFT_90823 [Endogone sp. FLAS-F59071]|eukprot:RUS16776.1 hypothetical protein BC937DRAFT_90823 [Endogone sp. FLAS-F59071]
MEIVISHLTRLDEQAVSSSSISTATPPPSPPLQFPAQKPFAEMTQLERMRAAMRQRDFSDTLAMKRSYHAMEILCGTAPANVKILQEKFYVIGSKESYVKALWNADIHVLLCTQYLQNEP